MYRFNPRNEHQWPRVVVLCGPNRSGAMGVNCARQLSSYGVHTVVVLSEPGLYTPQLANEMALYQFTTGTLITSAAGNTTVFLLLSINEKLLLCRANKFIFIQYYYFFRVARFIRSRFCCSIFG